MAIQSVILDKSFGISELLSVSQICSINHDISSRISRSTPLGDPSGHSVKLHGDRECQCLRFCKGGGQMMKSVFVGPS